MANPNCIAHSEAIARIEANTESIRDHLARLNGSVAKHEQSIADIQQRTAAFNAQTETTAMYRKQLEEWRERISEDVDNNKNELAELRGSTRSALSVIREVLGIVTLILLAWGAYSSHQQTLAAQHQSQQR